MAKPSKASKTKSDEQVIRETADEISKLLHSRGLGMQAVIQIFKLEPAKSPIIAAGNTESGLVLPGSENDVHPGILEALKPMGDEISRS